MVGFGFFSPDHHKTFSWRAYSRLDDAGAQGMDGRAGCLGSGKACSSPFASCCCEGYQGFLNDGMCVRNCACCAPLYSTPASLLQFILIHSNKLIYCLPSESNQVLLRISAWDSPASLLSLGCWSNSSGWEQNSWHLKYCPPDWVEYPCICVTAKGWKDPSEG